MIVRKLAESDLPSLAALYKQFWNEESSLERMTATFHRIEANPGHTVLVADEDGRLAGSAMGIVCEELYGDCRPFMVIEDVIVDKDFRRRGVGRAIMLELEAYAVASKCNYIIFVTELDRTAAHSFYESLGYKPDAYKGFKKRLRKRIDGGQT